RTILGRNALPSEINAWAAALAHGLNLEGLTTAFAGSTEYFTEQQGNDLPFADGASPGSLTQSTGAWVPIGPAPINVNLTGNPGPFSGRITGIAPDSGDPNTIFVAAAGGGVWKTTDGGATWAPKTDDQTNITMGAIAIAPSNSQVIYGGTGESDNSV